LALFLDGRGTLSILMEYENFGGIPGSTSYFTKTLGVVLKSGEESVTSLSKRKEAIYSLNNLAAEYITMS